LASQPPSGYRASSTWGFPYQGSHGFAIDSIAIYLDSVFINKEERRCVTKNEAP
jgi:hypothetical protein